MRCFLQECLSACCPCPETVRRLAAWPTFDLNGPHHPGKHGEAVPGEGVPGFRLGCPQVATENTSGFLTVGLPATAHPGGQVTKCQLGKALGHFFFHCLYMPHFMYPFFHPQALESLPHFDYCK